MRWFKTYSTVWDPSKVDMAAAIDDDEIDAVESQDGDLDAE